MSIVCYFMRKFVYFYIVIDKFKLFKNNVIYFIMIYINIIKLI